MKQQLPILLTNFRDYLKKNFPQSLSYVLNGELFIKIPFQKLSKFLFFLKQHTQCQYKILSDICAVDYPWKKNRFELFYNLLSLTFNSRITVILNIDEQTSVESITNIYNVSGWFEREIWDLFGIFFYNNKDLRRILTDYGFKGHPLRKDFPLTGYTEVRYSHIEKRILVDEVSLTQDYRTFYFNNSWSKNI
jgi:NADH:ubiquinone oxidoreductase subunit C